MTIKSFSLDQSEILQSIIELHCPSGIDVDVTYGNGVFYKSIREPILKFDIQAVKEGVICANCTNLPICSGIVETVMFDPPFLTYIKNGRNHNKNCIMSNRYGGYYTYQELLTHYELSLKEIYRILDKKGICVMKCQDIVHNHRLQCTHHNVLMMSQKIGFRLKDLFVLASNHRLPVRKNVRQQHARIHHSYFLVLQKFC